MKNVGYGRLPDVECTGIVISHKTGELSDIPKGGRSIRAG